MGGAAFTGDPVGGGGLSDPAVAGDPVGGRAPAGGPGDGGAVGHGGAGDEARAKDPDGGGAGGEPRADGPPRDGTTDPSSSPSLEARLRPLLHTAKGGSAVAVSAVRGGERTALARGGGTGTRFETGSVTKTFTALLLAELVARREVRYDDPVARYLPRGAADAPPITLLHLATHTSGLPRLPPGLLTGSARRAWYTNPYAGYSSADLLTAFSRAEPRHRPGTRVRYSNFGAGLLGHALVRAVGGSDEDPDGGYGALLTERVLTPLGLTDTDCDPDRPQAQGQWRGRPRPTWLIPGLPAAGALRSSARDLLTVLTALLDPPSSPAPPPLRAALADVQRPRLILPRSANRLCLVWNLRPRDGRPLLHHSGGTRGFTAFVGFLPRSGTALAALTNTAPTLGAPFIQAAYGTLCELDAGG
ncbi:MULTISPECIES: serine hydrolase domain-containing protein [unclassified Streptomyces]|uniref:serine hydrolase domain-containing protein n=1 Tax=unclassified Streptomyces TaxID=2593676 RepID=UPI001F4E913B|nr:serine hydrolase domain-containing protein [Streptomyces sp. AmelKG-E11A]